MTNMTETAAKMPKHEELEQSIRELSIAIDKLSALAGQIGIDIKEEGVRKSPDDPSVSTLVRVLDHAPEAIRQNTAHLKELVGVIQNSLF